MEGFKMNNVRRKVLRSIIEELERTKDRIDGVLDAEQCAFDNLSEGLQCTERGEAMEEAVDIMETAIDSLDEAIGGLEELV
jgi:hypothetical protein